MYRSDTMGQAAGNGGQDEVIVVRGLVKYLGRACVLDGVDLTVRRGQAHALLGLSGTGKSTVVQTLLGKRHPDSGTVTVLGIAPTEPTAELRRRLAGAYGEVHVWPHLTGGELITMSAAIHGGVDPIRRDELLSMFELDPTASGYLYTPEERRRLALIAALATDADVVVLDEPMAGLDLPAKRVFADWLARHRGADRTVLFTTRVFADAEMLADRADILHNGHVIGSGTIAELRGMARTAIIAELDRPAVSLADLPPVHNAELCRNTLHCDVAPEQLPPLLRALLAGGLRSLTSIPPTLEQLVERLEPDCVGIK
jgi:ABC-2 type transport system ATP-binding protein